MYSLQFIYPCLVAAVNVATGWFLYRLLESALGIVLLTVGVLVVVAVLVDTVEAFRPSPKSSGGEGGQPRTTSR